MPSVENELAAEYALWCYRDSSGSEVDTRRPVKLRELRRRSDLSRFQRFPFPRPPFFRPPMSRQGTPFQRPRAPIRAPIAYYRPQSPVSGRPGPAGDGMRWIPPRLTPPPPRPRPAEPRLGPRVPPGRPTTGVPAMTRPPPAAFVRQPRSAAGYRMQLRPRVPGQVCCHNFNNLAYNKIIIIIITRN